METVVLIAALLANPALGTFGVSEVTSAIEVTQGIEEHQQ